MKKICRLTLAAVILGVGGCLPTSAAPPPLRYTFTELHVRASKSVGPITIDDRGRVLLIADMLRGPSHAFLWQAGRLHNLGRFHDLDITTQAASMKKSWKRIFSTGSPTNGRATAAYSENGKWRSLGSIKGHYPVAFAANGVGQVAGVDYLPGGAIHPFLWTRGRAQDLTRFITPGHEIILKFPHDINNRGQIIVDGFRNGRPEAFLLTPQ